MILRSALALATAECFATVDANGTVFAEGACTSSGEILGPREIRASSGGSSGGPGAGNQVADRPF
jgi:hypothetical protein